jgi:hypothetical protein
MGAELLDEGGRGLDPQMAVGVDANDFIAERLARFPVGGQKHPGRIPALPPLLLRHVRRVKVIAGAPQPSPTHHHRRPPRRRSSHHRISDPPQPLTAPQHHSLPLTIPPAAGLPPRASASDAVGNTVLW